MNLSACMAIVRNIHDADTDTILAKVDDLRAAGMAPADAQRMAANDLIAEIDAEGAELRRLVREQHPDLFVAATPPPPPSAPRPRLFSDPRQARRISRGMPTVDDPMVPETEEFEKSLTGDLAFLPEHKGVPAGPIRLAFGDAPAPHKGFGLQHGLDNMKIPGRGVPKATDDDAENFTREVVRVARTATELYDGGGRLVLRSGSLKKALVLQRRGSYYSVTTLMPSEAYTRGGFIARVRTGMPAQHVIAGARRNDDVKVVIKQGKAYVAPDKPKKARALPDISQARNFDEDMSAQAEWLNEQARAQGYADIEELTDKDFDAFMALAERWRDENPMEIAAARPAGGYVLPRFGAGSMVVEAIQDRYNRWKQTIEAVRKQGGVVDVVNDFYRAEERYWGSVATRIEDFDREVKQFAKDVVDSGVTMEDVQLYAYAKHARERNAYLRTKRDANVDTGFDSWSGMTDEEADEILQTAKDEGVDQILAGHHATLMRWIKGTRDVMLDEGLITSDQYMMLDGFYDNYVPLRGKAGTKERRGTGSGFNIRGKEAERARGRYSMAENIIEHIIQDRTKALIRGGKNQVLRSFLAFVLQNPDANLWQINAVERRPVMTTDEFGNQLIEEQNAVIKDDTTIGIKDGGREVFVQVKDEKLLEQMRNMNVESLSAWLGYALMAQRALGRLYTSLNPVFTVMNAARDATAATFGMIGKTGFTGAGRTVIGLPGAMAEAWRAEFGMPSADYQLFRSTGGKTGFMDFKSIDKLAEELQERMAKAEMVKLDLRRLPRTITAFGKQITLLPEQIPLDPREFGPLALELIEKINGGIENGTRFAAWKAARAEGKTLAEASSISKNITVNFNRKGTWTPALSAWFLFFNPAVQGSVAVGTALRSPKVWAALGAGMTGVAMLALQNASMGDDDDGVAWWDKIPQSTKDRNLIILLPPTSKAGEAIPGTRTGRYVKIPLPYGWNWFATLVNQSVDLYRHGQDAARGVSPTTALKNLITSALGAYMPVQELSRSIENPKSAVLAAVPDFLNPVAQSLMNVNSFGSAMYPDDQQSKNLPDASKFFPAQAGTIFQRSADGLNDLTGGNKFKSGVLDFTPATIESLMRSYGGGPVSFSLDLMNAWYARQSVKREDLDVRRLPFIKQLYGQIDAETDRMLGYERLAKIEEVVDPVKSALRNKEPELAKALAEEGGALYKLGGAAKATREQLAALRKEELAIFSGKVPDEVKFARLQALDQRKRQVLQRMNAAYNDAMRGGPAP